MTIDRLTMHEMKVRRITIVGGYASVDRKQKDAINASASAAASSSRLDSDKVFYNLGRTDGFRQDLGAYFDDMTCLVGRLLRLLDNELATKQPSRRNKRLNEDARKTVLDPCCGGKMFYFDKHHPLVMYGDIRRETVFMTDRGKLRSLDIAPDVTLDFTGMPFLDDSFNFVVFDPPHLINSGKNSWLAKKYGKLDKDSWQDTLREGLNGREFCYIDEDGDVVCFTVVLY